MQTLNRSKCREGREGDRGGSIISREQRLHIRELIGKQGKFMCGVREARWEPCFLHKLYHEMIIQHNQS